MTSPLHWSAFTVTGVHDGDTVAGNLDLGYYLGFTGVQLRFYGINAPELVTTIAGHRSTVPAGEDATLHLLDLLGGRSLFAAKRLPATFGIPGAYLLAPGVTPPRLLVHTRLGDGDGDYEKFGRVLGEVFLAGPGDEPGLDVCAQMLADGMAVPMAG